MRSRQVNAPRLVVVSPARLRGQAFDLHEDYVTVGRDPSCQLVLDHPYVSRKHATLRRSGEHVVVQDLESTGGSTINGDPVTRSAVLKDGDLVSFADVTLRYQALNSAPTQTSDAQSRPEWTRVGPAVGEAEVRYDIGQQRADVLSNVGRDQYNSYLQQVIQQRESFLRDIAGTKTKARLLAWLGFLLVVVGFVLYGATIVDFIQQIPSFGPETQPEDVHLLGGDVAGVPVGVIGMATLTLGSVLLIVGIVLHVVAAARRRRVDRDLPPPFPRPPYSSP